MGVCGWPFRTALRTPRWSNAILSGRRAGGREFTQEHRILGENARIDALVEVHAPLHGRVRSCIALERGAADEAQVTNFSDDFFETR